MEKIVLYKNFPETPGVYLMKDARGDILYIGKAGNLRRRVSSYFLPARPKTGEGGRSHDPRIEKLVQKIRDISHIKTDTALDALILEAKLIKRYQPIFNVRERDDKSFLYVEIGAEEFPRVLLARGKDRPRGTRFGPFVSGTNLREALKLLRRIFPWNTHASQEIGRMPRACLNYEMGLCPGTCIGTTSRNAYRKTMANLKSFFRGEKQRVASNLKRDMQAASKKLDFERAEKIKRQLFSLEHVRDAALLTSDGLEPQLAGRAPLRIEGYDISNISGTSAVGSMVVFEGRTPRKNDYRRFRIRSPQTPNDVGMLKEVLERRFTRAPERKGWPLPQLVLVDGGMGQVNIAKFVLRKSGYDIPVLGIAKGPTRKRNDIIGAVPKEIEAETLVLIRNEAHRFAIAYHKKVRSRSAFRKENTEI